MDTHSLSDPQALLIIIVKYFFLPHEIYKYPLFFTGHLQLTHQGAGRMFMIRGFVS